VSLAQGLNTSGRVPGHKGFMDLRESERGRGRHLENIIVSVLWVINQSFHTVKYLSKVVQHDCAGSGRQDWDRMAVSSGGRFWGGSSHSGGQ
jgi:hypothetical protein